MLADLKPQFQLAILKGGSTRINEGNGRKHYCAWFVQGRSGIVHKSRKQFKRATECIQYAQMVVARYRRMIESGGKHVSTD